MTFTAHNVRLDDGRCTCPEFDFTIEQHPWFTKWSAWSNRGSFWPRRESLLQAIKDAGFHLVFEQFDGLGENIAESMSVGFYQNEHRSTFVGIKIS